MSTLKIGNKRELEKFLRILAEESVTAARTDTAMSAEKRQKDMMSRIRRDKADLSEEDPPEAGAAKPAAPEEKPAAEPPAPPKPPTPAEAKDVTPTLDGLIRAINEIRSGFATNDSAVKDQIAQYFDRLEEAEQIALIVMLRSLGDILRKEVEGSAAPEPDQFNVVMSLRPKEGEVVAKSAPQTASPPQSAIEKPEDTSPPIKVGEPVTEAYRAKIRDLLRRSQ